MNNRIAFIDFVRGLLNINPLERWSPQQAKLHPFITQQKYTGQFVPPMNLKSSSLNRSPAPGTQQQQQAEALSKQRAQATAQPQAHPVAQGTYGHAPSGSYHGTGHPQPPVYSSSQSFSSTGSHSNIAPAYGSQSSQYGQMGMGQQPQQHQQQQAPPQQQQQLQQPQQQHMPQGQYANVQQHNMYSQGGLRTNRQRASTMEQQQSGIPAAIQRVASHLDPSQPIRLQPSPAYYPPTADNRHGSDSTGRGGNRRGGRAQQTTRSNRDFIRNLEERTLEEGFMGNQNPWH